MGFVAPRPRGGRVVRADAARERGFKPPIFCATENAPLERCKRAPGPAALDPPPLSVRESIYRDWRSRGVRWERFLNVESSLLLFSLPHIGGNVGALCSTVSVPPPEGDEFMIIAPAAQRANASLRPVPPHPSLPCVRGGGTSAHTGAGRVVTCTSSLAEDVEEGSPSCRRPSPTVSANSADRLQPLSLLRRQLPLHRGALGGAGGLPKAVYFHQAIHISTRGRRQSRSRDDSTFRNRPHRTVPDRQFR